ncbi:MAG: glycosyltransferase family 39 protein, partial [Sulfurimonas sp.]|nr:glycosyltransferase family 39 protein [Sulfurimonas sp.]
MYNFFTLRPKQSAYFIILFLAIFSAIYNAFLPLHGDEAYYWMWSHHLQSGYYDHPPMIAYLIYLTNFISESQWGVRLVNVFSFSIAALYIFKLSSEMFDEHIALNAVIIFSSLILVHAGYIITTPDSPLILFWT